MATTELNPPQRRSQSRPNSARPDSIGEHFDNDSQKLLRQLSAASPSASMPQHNWLTWALFSAFFAGITAILAKIGVANVDSNFATAIRTTIVLLFTWAIAAITNPRSSLT